MINIIVSICFLSFTKLNAEETCPVQICNGTYPSEDSYVEIFCKNNEGHMDERCCTANNTLIGLDLRSCGVDQINITEYNFSDLIIMDLTENNIKKLTTDDLTGLIHLNELYLPSNVPCPGGPKAWNKSDTSVNFTECCIQKNPCIDLKIDCTDNGDCIHTGPGSAKCICKSGHFGYKCLNEGEFPSTIFASSLSATTIVLCVLLWFGVGRDVYRSS